VLGWITFAKLRKAFAVLARTRLGALRPRCRSGLAGVS